MKQATLLLLGTIGSLVTIGVSRAQGGGAVTGGAADSVSVRSLDKGGMVTVQKGYQATFGSSKLTAERVVGFSPNGVLWSADRLENVVIEGGGLRQPLFMPAATLSSTPAGEPMLVSDSVATAVANVIVTYTGSASIVYANAVSTGQKSVCLSANYVVTCTDDGGHVATIRTRSACSNN